MSWHTSISVDVLEYSGPRNTGNCSSEGGFQRLFLDWSDEIIARHINPMASHMRDLLNFKVLLVGVFLLFFWEK